ncbi:MAG: histone deacetylase family protein [Minwuiales bacterium]|nr:histone deacetylase family protein [Minwuiales bacterium]
MQIIYDPSHERHAPETFISAGRVMPNPEVVERATRLLAAVEQAGHEVVAPDPFGHDAYAAVHTGDYLEFLSSAHALWSKVAGASDEVVPNAHPGRHMHTRPHHIVGLAGYHMADTACPIGAGTWRAARGAADCALTAAARVMDGARVVYSLCRPPGHHAYSDMAGGFCFLNNVAIAAQFCRSKVDRVAILDVDVHHGNGTQGIFYDRPDVLFCSLHGDPAGFYPFFAGYVDERGAGDGQGTNLNLPLPRGTGDDAYLDVLAGALDAIVAYKPDVLLVSLGLDAQENDPLGILSITTDGFARMAAAIAQLGLPTVLVQEGGYLCDELGTNLVSFLQGFEGAARSD